MSIIEELYYGNVSPGVAFHGKDSKYAELARLCEKNRNKLMELLNESEKEAFEKFVDTQDEMSGMTIYDRFAYGFRLGTLLTAEAFTGLEKMMSIDE